MATFSLVGGTEKLDEALQDIYSLVFDESLPRKECATPAWDAQMQDIFNYKNLVVEDCDEDPWNITIPKSEGERAVAGPLLQKVDVTKPLKLKEVNIGTEEKPKLAKIGDH